MWLGIYPDEIRSQWIKSKLNTPDNIILISLIAIAYSNDTKKITREMDNTKIHLKNGNYTRGIIMKIVNIKDIYYSLDNIDILKGISIDIKEGDCISLIGQSGSGKSTLMKLCADLVPISKGNIIKSNKSRKFKRRDKRIM